MAVYLIPQKLQESKSSASIGLRIALRSILLFIIVLVFLSIFIHSINVVNDISVILAKRLSRNMELNSQNDLPKITKNEKNDDILYPSKDDILNQDPNYPHIRDWVKEHIYFTFFDGIYIYTNDVTTIGSIKRKPNKNEKQMFAKISEKAADHLRESPGVVNIVSENCKSIRYRLIPTIGIEFDVECSSFEKKPVIHRVNMIQQLSEPQVTFQTDLTRRPNLRIIITLSGRLDMLKIFMKNLYNILPNYNGKIAVTLVYFEDGNSEKSRKIFEEYNTIFPRFITEFIVLNLSFSRGAGLQAGVDHSKLDTYELLFFCDVDMIISVDSLNRCVGSTVKNKQIFAPVVFSLFNPELVYGSNPKSIPDPLEQITLSSHGFWRIWGYGMICIYKEDFLNIGGFSSDKIGWGGEDHALMVKAIHSKHNFKIIRSLEPGMHHQYHSKDCRKQRSRCRKIKSVNEGSQLSLANWYFKNKDKIKT